MDNTKREFGLRLAGMIRDRGWNQSEAARRADMGRDNISGYVNGRYLPSSKHLNALCQAFGVQPEELIPDRAAVDRILSRASTPPQTNPMLSMEQLGDGDQYFLRLQQVLPLETVMKIAALVKEGSTK